MRDLLLSILCAGIAIGCSSGQQFANSDPPSSNSGVTRSFKSVATADTVTGNRQNAVPVVQLASIDQPTEAGVIPSAVPPPEPTGPELDGPEPANPESKQQKADDESKSAEVAPTGSSSTARMTPAGNHTR